MIKKAKLIPIICGICATTATVVPAVSCTCSFVTEKLQLSGGNIRLETSTNTAGSDAEENKWVLKYNEEEIPYDKWESVEIKSLGDSDVSKIHFDTEKHIVKWDAIEEAKAYAFVIAVKTVDGLTCESTPIVLDVNENKPDVYILEGGNTYLEGAYHSTGSDKGTWVLKEGDIVVEDATYSVDGDVDEYKIDIDKDGKVSWDTSETEKTGPARFDVIAKVDDEEKARVSVTLNIKPADVYTVTGGSVSLTAQAGAAGEDDGAWQLMKNGSDVDGETFTIAEATPPIGVSVDGKTGQVSWNEDVVVGSEMVFHVKATLGAIERLSPDIHLYVNPADVYGVSGGTNLLSISTGSTNKDANIWVATKNGHEISNVNYELSANTPICFQLVDPENAKNGKQLSWTNATDFDGTIQILITRGEGTEKQTLASADIKIVVKPNISAIEIVGDDVIYATTGSHYAIKTYPESTSIGATWEVTSWVPDVAGQEQPELDPRETDCIINAGNVSGTLTIKATSTVDTSLVVTKQIRVEYPWKDSNQIWGYYTHEGQTGWYEFDEDSLYATDSDISCTPLGGGAETTIARDEFVEYDIYIGDKVTRIKDNFLNGCIAFNSPITFGDDNECIMIGDNFLAGDAFAADPVTMAFNQTLVLPDTVVEIGDDFLAACSTFNNGSTATDPQTIELHMPTALERIGDEFLNSCRVFNQNLTIADTVQSVGNEFMQNCDNMQSTVTINTDAINFRTDGGLSLSFASDTVDEPICHSVGIKIAGTAADGIIAKFGELQYTPDGNWRLLHQ